jgi:hypothetical protein
VLLESGSGSGSGTESDRLYLVAVHPRDVVSAVVDNSYAAGPRRVLTDRC